MYVAFLCYLKLPGSTFKETSRNYPESLLVDKSLMVTEQADFEDVERLSLVTSGKICSANGPDLVKLGRCELIKACSSSSGASFMSAINARRHDMELACGEEKTRVL